MITTLKDKLSPTEYTPWVLYTAVGTALANLLLIVTGAVVRLTGSGLGCDTWPRCTDEQWTTTPAQGIHGFVEFGNRMLTFVLMVITVLAFFAVLRLALPQATVRSVLPKLFTGLRTQNSRYSDLFNLTLLLLWGIPLQAVIGGITVWQRLNPWMVTAHYMASAVMIGLAAVLINRVRRYFKPATAAAENLDSAFSEKGRVSVQVLGWFGLVLVVFLVFMGTVVTGTGPHAGDPRTHRHDFNPIVIARLHAWAVWVYLVSLMTLYLIVRAYALPKAYKFSLAVLTGVIACQGTIGYIQYNTGLPALLVEAHMLGSGLFTWAAISLIERQLTLTSRTARELVLSRRVQRTSPQ